MEQYEKMLEKNRKQNATKVDMALKCMRAMNSNDEQVSISELVKKTGLSRTFFYNNKIVRGELEKIKKSQKHKNFTKKQKVVFDKALTKELELLKRKLREKDSVIDNLKRENEKLKKIAKAKELTILKEL